MKIGIIIAVLLAITVFFACNTASKTATEEKPSTTPKEETISTSQSEVSKLYEIAKSPCFGMCPVFLFTINSDGSAVYDGKRWVDKNGVHKKQLSKTDFNAIKAAFESTNLSSYEDNYPNQIMDLPTWKIIEYKNGTKKEISGYQNMPEELKTLVKKMDALANAPDGWKGEEGAVNYTGIVQDELIVKFKKDTDSDKFLELFSAYQLRKEKRLSTSLELYLLKYRRGSIEPTELLDLVKKHDDVISAEFNKKVNPRDAEDR